MFTTAAKRTGLLAALLLLAAGVACAQYEAPDPSSNIPNGRTLGLGRAGAGYSDDTAAIYCNPAGLAKAANWQFTTMSGKFLDEFSYLSFSGIYPTDVGSFGLGFVGASISGAFATVKDPNSSDDDPIYVIDTTKPPVSYFNNVYHLSYGTNLSRFIRRFGWEKQFSIGASAKLFSSALSGADITNGSANGTELDLGILYDTNLPWLTLGANAQNILPASMGGKLRYETGHEESYPAAFRFGAAWRVIGKNNSIRTFGAQELKLVTDYIMHPTLSQMPATLHLGAEYNPVPMVALRMGIDQDALGDGLGTGVGTTSNLTGGVGFNFGGFRFDYAYHQFSWAANSATNYFSLTYSPPIKEEVKQTERVAFTSPVDKTLTFEAQAAVKGRVNDTGIVSFTLNGLAPRMDLDGNFNQLLELKIGKNKIAAVGKDRGGKPNFERNFRLLRLQEFPDVQRSYWVAKPISLLAMSSIITGYPDGSFKPEGNITRAEMCSLLMKTKGTEEASSLVSRPSSINFKDVPSTHWASKFISRAASTSVVKGYPGNLFKPNGKITRAEGLAMITRFSSVSEEVYQYEFPDVAYSHWAAKLIAGAAKVDMLEFLAGKRFEPDRALTRAEAVEMLYKSPYVYRLLSKGLLDWESY
ncbi:MAG: S-layer homology domain-containing protein [Candidatus Margulisbacteria bacterium]|nr:S-layer homology domain-containing protein [Candidatus Margulisiibacteriota bacterium]